MSLPPDTGSVELIAFSQHVRQLLSHNERLDGRRFDQTRRPSIVREVAGSSSPASFVSEAGARGLLSSVIYTDDKGTCISGTVHGVFGPPRAQTPSEGRLNVRLAAPFIQEQGFTSAGGHSNAAVTNGLADLPLQQVEGFVMSVLASCLDLGQLAIIPGEACWVLTVTLTLLNADGGLRGAALHAAVGALHGLVLPRARLPNGVGVAKRVLNFSCVPVACTLGVLGGAPVRLLSDMSAIEEYVVDGTLTVTLDEAGDVVDLQQLGQYPLLSNVLVAAIHACKANADSTRAVLSAA